MQLVSKVCLEKAVLNFMCRSHSYERHVNHVVKAIHGKKKSPSRKLYEYYRKTWIDLELEQKINPPSDLLKLCWRKPEFQAGGLLYNLLKESLQFCQIALARKEFIRGDYEYLIKLIVIFLGGTVEDFRFRQPRDTSDCRWMVDLIYNLEMEINSSKLEQVDPPTLEKLVLTSEYVAFFHGMFFLQASVASKAPNNDLRAIKIATALINDEKLSKRFGKIGEELLTSVQRHDWYLRPQLVVLALADDNVESSEKVDILEALLKFEVPEEFQKGLVPALSEISHNTKLSELVNQESYYLFTNTALHMTKENLNEMLLELKEGKEDIYLSKFVDYVHDLQVKFIKEIEGRVHKI